MTNLPNNILLKVVSTALVLMVVATVSGQTGRKSRFDPDGAFWIHGDRSNDFSDFSGINLNAKKVRHLPAAGVELINGKRFPFRVLSVKQESFTFTTVAVSKISYSFAGRFLRGGVYLSGNLDDETPVLEGVLTKYKAGKKVAQAKLSFVYFGGT